MRIRFAPNYPEWAASSRLRIYTLQRALKKLGHDAEIGLDLNADIMEFQKNRGIMDTVKQCMGKVIYDFDDVEVYDVVKDLEPYLINFTTDTLWHRLDSPFPQRTTIIPDPIDFCPDSPQAASNGTGVVWFGHETGWNAVTYWVRELARSGIKVRVISRPTIAAETNAVGAEFVEWNADTFTSELRKSKAALLSHYGSNHGKSNNRMLVALTYGLRCIVSTTPEYEDLAFQIGGAAAIVQEPELDLEYIKDFLKSDGDITYAQQYVWDRYHPEVVAKLWLKTVEAI